MKKICSIALSLILSASLMLCFPIISSAEQSGDYIYEIRDSGAVITKYVAESGKLVIPAELGGYPVIELGEMACQSPDYENPITVSSIELPSTLKKIGYRAFFNIQGYEQLTIPEGVVEIGKEAFMSSDNIKIVSIPASVTAIGENAFQFCAQLKEINVAAGNKSYSSQDGILFNADGSELIRFPQSHKATEYTISTNVKKITANAFHDCLNLKKLTVPGSLGKITSHAFFRCSSVEEVVLGDGITEIGEMAFCACTSLKKINIPEGVTKIGDWALNGNRALTALTLPSTLKTIGETAFLGVRASKIDIPKGVTSIGHHAFQGAYITEVTIPNGIAKIEEGTFANCGYLTRLFIPKSVKSISKENFQIECLKMIYYEGTEAEFKKISVGQKNDAFKEATVVYNCTGLPSTTDHTHNFANFVTSEPLYLGLPTTKTGYCTVCGEKSVENLDSTYTDKMSGITISAPVDAFSEPAMVTTCKIDMSSDKIGNIKLALSSVSEDFVAFEINLTKLKMYDQPIQPTKPITITFDIPEDFDDNIGVYFVAEDGSLEAIPSKVSEDGKTVVAEVTHFSTYAVCKLKSGVKAPVLNTESSKAESNENADDTVSAAIGSNISSNGNNGNNSGNGWWVISIIAAVVICGGAVFAVIAKEKFSKKESTDCTEKTEE